MYNSFLWGLDVWKASSPEAAAKLTQEKMEQEQSPLGKRGKVPLAWIAADLIVTRLFIPHGLSGGWCRKAVESGEVCVFLGEDGKNS